MRSIIAKRLTRRSRRSRILSDRRRAISRLIELREAANADTPRTPKAMPF
jgi:hypothetical protein